MDAPTRVDLHRAALAGMTHSRPKNLVKALRFYADDSATPTEVGEDDFLEALLASSPGDDLLELWRRHLAQWDMAATVEWSPHPAKSDDRRSDLYNALGLDDRAAEVLSRLLPVTRQESPTVISKSHTPWYTVLRRTAHEWYWPRYDSLLAQRGWSAESIASLDESTTRVVERLADPTAPSAYQSKGLVVGYVQSGKTANFTGVIAKAMDAGYRLVIVLGGRLNLLRAQTQRRLDMELVGRENILRGSEHSIEYGSDAAWVKHEFVEYGAMPSELGGFDVERMTTHERDYRLLSQGIAALESQKTLPSAPYYDQRNLYPSAARLVVVKKHATTLRDLIHDLRILKTPLDQIPTLIIDDESDDASLNTKRHDKPDAERTTINARISELLTLLPRAQYIGYTATPYANVFVDPADSADIFPNEFIISLPYPEGYMGPRDFHDLDPEQEAEDRAVTDSNELAYVRSIGGEEGDDDDRLREAIDMFVLTGAVKLHRLANGSPERGYERAFQHHTMLIHESIKRADHRALADIVIDLWFNSGYSGPVGHARLRKLFETDLTPVSSTRAETEDPVPATYDELMPFVAQAVMRIGGDDQPVIVVNSDADVEKGVADFDKRTIWKILLGGQSLSRGFTVEGLTVSYYRRRTYNASSLMQMGRWFGFRRGYRDLVRLYIGRSEGKTRREIDLYEAFEAVCLDEQHFREQLDQYATPVDGTPQITPANVPPLVLQRLGWLKPTAPNKMYNARLVEIRTPGSWAEPVAYPKKAAEVRRNVELWSPVFQKLSQSSDKFAGVMPPRRDGSQSSYAFSAFTTLLPHADLMSVLDNLVWLGDQFKPHLEYLWDIGSDGERQVDDWLVMAPQSTKKDQRITIAGRELSWFPRRRRRDPLFGVISDPKHRPVGLRVAGASASAGDRAADGYAAPRRGAVALYPIVEPQHRENLDVSGRIDSSQLVIAFCFVAPGDARGSDNRIVRFTTIDSSREDEAIVDAT